ncbi:MAG TPA: amino acid permease, partial [Actinomycetota bacterium]|nr:amino acid permease [Actinomycetota bacterium]
YYARERRAEFNAFRHVVVPVVGTLFFIPGWLTAMGIAVFDFISPLAYPYSLAGPIVGVILGLGVIYLLILYSTDRRRITDTAKVFLDEEAAGVSAPV